MAGEDKKARGNDRDWMCHTLESEGEGVFMLGDKLGTMCPIFIYKSGFWWVTFTSSFYFFFFSFFYWEESEVQEG